jgi:hypothetical protein
MLSGYALIEMAKNLKEYIVDVNESSQDPGTTILQN